MKADLLALPSAQATLPAGRGSPIVAGEPLSVSPPIEDSWFHVLALIGGIGALIATELGVAGPLALHL